MPYRWVLPVSLVRLKQMKNQEQPLEEQRAVRNSKGGYTLVTLPRIVTPYRDCVDGTRARVTYQKLVTR